MQADAGVSGATARRIHCGGGAKASSAHPHHIASPVNEPPLRGFFMGQPFDESQLGMSGRPDAA